MKILVLNGGSSSFKCWFAELPAKEPNPLWTARSDWSHHTGVAEIKIKGAGGVVIEQSLKVDAPVQILDPVLKGLWTGETKVISGPSQIDAVGHRIVHGGPDYREPTLLNPDVRAAIAQQVEFAPAHNRFELEAIECVDQVIGHDVPQVAVFDTGFHKTLKAAAYVYPGPYEWLEKGVRRYGFHGINHRYASERAAALLKRDPKSLRMIVCHLGNGGSLCAIQGGESVDTTMGFTPLEGLMMGSRSGSIDPGILIYLIRHRGYSAEQLDDVLNKNSGLLGVSGQSSDMREILKQMKLGDARAALAFDVYVHRLVREAGAMLTVMGGLDVLVFTGGIGENVPEVRTELSKRLAFLGLKLDLLKNATPQLDQDVATDDSRVRAVIVQAQEEWAVAQDCYRVVGKPNVYSNTR